jgi:hypothetical protein
LAAFATTTGSSAIRLLRKPPVRFPPHFGRSTGQSRRAALVFAKAARITEMEAQTVIEHIHHKSIESDQWSIEVEQAGLPV